MMNYFQGYENCVGTKSIEIDCEYVCQDDSNVSGNSKRNSKRKKEGILALFKGSCHSSSPLKDDDESNENFNYSGYDCFLPSDRNNNEVSLYMVITDGQETFHGRICMNSIKILSNDGVVSKVLMEDEYDKFDKKLTKEQNANKQLDRLLNILLNPKRDNINITYTQKYINQKIPDTDILGHSYNNIHSNNSYCNYNDSLRKSIGFNNHNQCISIMIKQSVKNFVSVVYSGNLTSKSPEKSTSSQNNNHGHSNIMSFLRSLTSSFNKSQTQIETLQNQNKRLQKQLNGWKDTATKLDDAWQREKDDTLQSYLVLLNHIKRDLRTVKEELRKEKQQCKLLKEKQQKISLPPTTIERRMGRKISSSSASPLLKIDETSLDEYIDDNDEDSFDEHEVELLSQGKRVFYNTDLSSSSLKTSFTSLQPKRKRTKLNNYNDNNKTENVMTRQSTASSHQSNITDVTNADEDTDSDTSSQPSSPLLLPSKSHPNAGSQSSNSMRSNPLTGAIEMWSTDYI